MEKVHIALLVIGALLILESVGGILAPRAIRKLTRVAAEAEESNTTYPVMGTIMLAGAMLLWAFVMDGLPLTHWILLFIGATIAALGLLCFRDGGMRSFMTTLIANRSASAIRLIYFCELTAGALVIWLAIR